MQLSIRQPILLIWVLILFLGSCTELESRDDQKSDENSITGDSGNRNVTTWDTADSAKRLDSSENEAGSAKGGSGDDNTLTPNSADAGVSLDASTTDSKQINSDTGTEDSSCGSGELLCDDSCVPNDEINCGECGHNCTELAHVAGPVECEEGKCVLTSSSCESGWADCNEDSEDGCETNITEAKNCGGCGNDCSETAKPLCAPIEGDNRYECATDCPSNAPTLCGDSCVNTENDPLHCSECDNECETYPSSRPVCDEAKCDFECKDDSHIKCPEGCFPNDDKNCGTCGNDCTESNEVCDELGNCVECIPFNNDCEDPAPYCVLGFCRPCLLG